MALSDPEHKKKDAHLSVFFYLVSGLATPAITAFSITHSSFTASAYELASTNGIVLWNREMLIDKVGSFFI